MGRSHPTSTLTFVQTDWGLETGKTSEDEIWFFTDPSYYEFDTGGLEQSLRLRTQGGFPRKLYTDTTNVPETDVH